MSWVYPGALWLLLLVLLLLFARQRQARRRVAVGNLYLWTQAASRETATVATSLRRQWLVILQCAIVAALVVAIAGPLVQLGRTHVAIVLDASMSMGARDGNGTRLDLAKTRLTELLATLPHGTHAQVWLAAAAVKDLGTFARGDTGLAAALANVRATDAAADLADAVRRARAAASAPHRVYVISDTAPESMADVAWLSVGGAAENLAVTNLAIRRQPSGVIDLLVNVSNYGTTAHEADMAITANGVGLARTRLSLPSRGAAAASIVLPAGTRGVVAAQLQLDDALAADDTRTIALITDARLRVLNLAGGRFVADALAADSNVEVLKGVDANVDVVVSSEGAPPESAPADAGLLVLPPPSRERRPAAPAAVTSPEHPILASVFLERLAVLPLDTGRTLDEGAVLARAGGIPIVAAYEHESRRVVELRFDSSDPTLALDAAFPILVANALDWLAAPRRETLSITAGQPLRLVRREGSDAPVVTASRWPIARDGSQRQATGGERHEHRWCISRQRRRRYSTCDRESGHDRL